MKNLASFIKDSILTPHKIDELKAKLSLEHRLLKAPSLTYSAPFVSMLRRLTEFESRCEDPEAAEKIYNLPVKQALFWSLKQMLQEIISTEDEAK